MEHLIDLGKHINAAGIRYPWKLLRETGDVVILMWGTQGDRVNIVQALYTMAKRRGLRFRAKHDPITRTSRIERLASYDAAAFEPLVKRAERGQQGPRQSVTVTPQCARCEEFAIFARKWLETACGGD